MSQKQMIQTVTDVIGKLCDRLNHGSVDIEWEYEITSRYEMEVTIDATRYFFPINKLKGKNFEDKVYHKLYFRYNEALKFVEIKMPLNPFQITFKEKYGSEDIYEPVDIDTVNIANLWIVAAPIFFPQNT